MDANTTRHTAFIVVPAPGHYGDRSVVLSAHYTQEAALKAAGKGRAVYRSHMARGAEWLRVYEQHCERIRGDA